MSGRLVFIKELTGDGFIPVSPLNDGMYIVRLVTDSVIWEKKLVKK